MTSNTSASTEEFAGRIAQLPVAARKLLCLIARQCLHGSLRAKAPETATMPELHEACGLDVEAMYSLLSILCGAGLAWMEGEYPFETLRVPGEVLEILRRSEAAGIPVEEVLVDLRFMLLG